MFKEYKPVSSIPRVSTDRISMIDDEFGNNIKLSIDAIYTVSSTRQQYRLIEILDANSLMMQNILSRELDIISVHNLLGSDTAYKNKTESTLNYVNPDHFEYIGDQKWIDMHKRFIAIVPFLRDYTIRESKLNKQVSDTGIDKSDLKNWYRRFTENHEITDLLDRRRPWYKPKSGFHFKNSYHTQRAIEKFYLSEQRPSVEATVREVQKTCHNRQINPPNDAFIRKTLAQLPDTVIMRKRGLKGMKPPKMPTKTGILPKSDFGFPIPSTHLYHFEDID